MTAAAEAHRIYVTFGADHTHPVSGRNLANHYVVVDGTDYEDCRRQTVQRFGNRWSFDYLTRVATGADRFGLTEVDLATGELVP